MVKSGWSFFRFQTSRDRVLESYAQTLKSLRPPPLISMIGGWGSKCYNNIIFTELNLKSEIKIHMGVDDKQFALPYHLLAIT